MPKCVATIVVPAIVGVVDAPMFLTVCEKTNEDEVIVSACEKGELLIPPCVATRLM